jgi:NAD(P)-dependent dehydrogenase (short-subunit alcohol dehydrogenase family)
MDMGLRGKTALVTGASQGIGRACAQALAAEGAMVAICARDGSALEEAARQIRDRAPAHVIAVAGDMTVPEDIARVVNTAARDLGALEILVNAAGASAFGPFAELPDDAWWAAMELKYLGYIRCAREAIPHMRKSGWGRIINIVGNGGRHPMPLHMPGSASNAALLSITKNLSDTLATEKILVNAVNPGVVETRRMERLVQAFATQRGSTLDAAREELLREIPLGRPARPDEIGAAVVFLASEHASYITGIALTVDGGMSRSVP